MAITLLFALMLLVTLMRVFLPKGVEVPGKKVFELKLSMIERLIYQRINLYALGAVLALMTLTGSIANGFQLLIVLATQAILLIPLHVVVTSEGVALNRVLFRPWSDFAGFEVGARYVSLLPHDGSRPLRIPALEEHQSELVQALSHRLSRVQAGKEAASKRNVTVG